MTLRLPKLRADLTREQEQRLLNEFCQDVAEFLKGLDVSYHAGGALAIESGATAQTLTTSYATLDHWQEGSGHPEHMLEEPDKNRLVIQRAGLYFIGANLSLTGASGKVVDLDLALDNQHIRGGGCRITCNPSLDPEQGTCFTLEHCHPGQWITVQAKVDVGSDITVREGILLAVSVAPVR